MKIVLHSTEEFNLTPSQIRLLRVLAKDGPTYLHDKMADLADKTPGIYDSGEGKYAVSQRGWRILFELDKQKKKS